MGERPKARKLRGAKTVECPTCGAPVGEPCRASMRTWRMGRPVQSHCRRVEIAKTGRDPWLENDPNGLSVGE